MAKRFFLSCSWLASSLLRGSLASPYCNLGPQGALKIADPLMVCVFVSTSPPKKMIFRLTVEEYTSLVLHGSAALSLGAQIPESGGAISQGPLLTQNESDSVANDIHTWISTSTEEPAISLNCNSDEDMDKRGNFVSCPQIYANGDHMAKLLSLVVNLRDGVVHSLVWDNGCDGCGPQRCMKSALQLDPTSMVPGAETFDNGACGKTHLQCGENKADCDLQILVTWAGTDKDGNHLQSAGRRISRFGGDTIASMYETMDYMT